MLMFVDDWAERQVEQDEAHGPDPWETLGCVSLAWAAVLVLALLLTWCVQR